MLKFIIKRILLMIPVMLGVIILVFFVSRALPGDPVAQTLGSYYTEEQYVEMEKKMGLDKPLPEQLINYIVGVVTEFDFGTSYSTAQPVKTMLANRVWVSIKLGLMSIVITALLGIPFGVISATKQYSVTDYSVTSIAIFLASMPGFWLALMSIIIFSQWLGWLPASGLTSWKHYILPVLCNAMAGMAITTRMTRSSMLEVIRQDYISTARSKGLKEGVVIRRHALRNAIIPVITVIGNQCSIIIGGSVIIESIFSIPGMGTLMVSSINNRDYPTVLGVTLIISFFVCIVNMVVDIVYCFVDPRMKAQMASSSKKKRKRKAAAAVIEPAAAIGGGGDE